MIELGKGAVRGIEDIRLTRYACYPLANAAQNPASASNSTSLDWLAIGGVIMLGLLALWAIRAVILGDSSGLGPAFRDDL